jgi:uncharacterized protein (TIGR00369 family)
MTAGTENALCLNRAKDFLDRTPISRWLNADCATLGDELLFHLSFEERHIGNPVIRALHGGVISAFLELSMQAAYAAETGAGGALPTANFSIDFLRSSKPEDMHCQVAFERLGRRIAFVRALGWQGDRDKPVALARTVIRTGTGK